MQRYDNKSAGIDFIKRLRLQHKFYHDVLIFCNYTKGASDKCVANEMTQNIYVTNKSQILRQFMSYQTIDF